MKKIIFTLFLLSSFYIKAQLVKSLDGTVSFFSEAPLQNIDATSKNLVSAINTSTQEIVFEVAIQSLEFKNKKMQQDFNEDYMESEKYPLATYKGKINEKLNWKKDGTYPVTSTGRLSIHGVEKERTDPGTLIIKNGKISLSGSFRVKVADHNIKIPQILFEKIAEEVSVKFSSDYK